MRLNKEVEMKRAPWWDLVGLALTHDKRLLIVLPGMLWAANALSDAQTDRHLRDALFNAPSVVMHCIATAWAWL